MADSEASVAAPPGAPQAAGAGFAAALRGRLFAVFEAAAAPHQHQAPPPARTTAAAALRGLLARVADAVLLGFCSALWANHTANGVAIAARSACGEYSHAAAVARKASDAAFVAMAVLVPVAAPRFFWIIERWPRTGDRQSGSGVTRRADAQLGRSASSGPGARPCPNDGPASVTLALQVVFFCVAVALVGMLVQLHAPGKVPYQEKFGSAISSMASLMTEIVLSFFLIPGMIIQLWRHGCDGLRPVAAQRMNHPSSGAREVSLE